MGAKSAQGELSVIMGQDILNCYLFYFGEAGKTYPIFAFWSTVISVTKNCPLAVITGARVPAMESVPVALSP